MAADTLPPEAREFKRVGDCVRCGQCCSPDPSPAMPLDFTAEQLADPDRVEGYCPMFRFVDGVGHCLGHGWHPYYMRGCFRHPVTPLDIVLTPACSYVFEAL